MAFTNELLLKAKNAKSVEELRKLAEENGVNMSTEELEAKYKALHSVDALSNEELANAAGGDSLCYDDPPAGPGVMAPAPQPVQKSGDDYCSSINKRTCLGYGGEYTKFYQGWRCETCTHFYTDLNKNLDPNYNGTGYCFRGIVD